METFFIIGRIIFGGIIVFSGLSHFLHIHKNTELAQKKGVFLPELMVIVTGVMLMAGGAGIIFWKFVPYSLAVLVVFFLVTTFAMHNFWSYKGSERISQMYAFLGNMQILGLLLILFALFY